MFGATEEEEMVPPITHVSVTLDGIPEVVEVHQAPDPYAESPETPEFEQPKKKKGKVLPENSSVQQESREWHGLFLVGVWNHLGCQVKITEWRQPEMQGKGFSSCTVWAHVQVLRLMML